MSSDLRAKEFIRKCMEWRRTMSRSLLASMEAHAKNDGRTCCHLFSYYVGDRLPNDMQAVQSWKTFLEFETDAEAVEWLEVQIAIFNVTETINADQ